MTTATAKRRTFGAVDDTTRRQIAELRERTRQAAEPKAKGDEMDQGTFWRWAREGVDGEASEKVADELEALVKFTAALAAMAKQGKVQPAHADKLHAVQRVAQMGEQLHKMADALAKVMEGGE